MSLQAVKSASLADKIFAQIAAEIISSRYPAGTKLPAERKLSELFEVNRHGVREALKRLEQVGLIRISQGGSTEVLDFRQTAGLDLLGLMARHAEVGAQTLASWRSVLEMRAALAADVVRLFTQRAAAPLKNEVRALSEQMQTAADDASLFALEIRFWDTLLLGADNLAYRLAFNSMLASLNTVADVMRAWSVAEIRKSDCHRKLVEAISRGDAQAAELDVQQLMRKGLQRFERMAAGAAPAAPTTALA